jgi:hypothetical protein
MQLTMHVININTKEEKTQHLIRTLHHPVDVMHILSDDN